MHMQSRRDWAGFEPAAIPTKHEVPLLERWLEQHAPTRVLDLGCGAGRLAALLCERGLSVVGVDINAAAITQLQHSLPQARFYERDVASPAGLALEEPAFEAAICQLVASVVGDARDRLQLVQNAHGALRPGAPLFISFSGLSDDLNPSYAELYARDAAETGEHGSYFSRDAEGQVLYRTHHFAHDEIVTLLAAAGFIEIQVDAVVEASSRRPDQRARFYYATCRRSA